MKLSLSALHLVHKAKRQPLHPLPVVYRHWRWLLLVVFIALLLVITLAFFVFINIQYGESTTTPEGEAPVRPRTINRTQIEMLENRFKAREGAYESLKAARPTLADPAL
jgi:hypothetical protein